MQVAFRCEKIGKICPGQDGAIFGDYIFRFSARGLCSVFSFDTLEPLTSFMLDRLDAFMPHSNAVCFGAGKYAEEDEFPLLYTNIYNTYQLEKDQREGVCCVYRILRNGLAFRSELVQVIKIGFTAVRGLWRSENLQDVRPYGNFLVDGENSRLYAFTMVDELQKTRFFAFALPPVRRTGDGFETVVLTEGDILSSFDSEYSYYIQGAVFCRGKIISSEGFTDNCPGIRIFDVNRKTQQCMIPLMDYGLSCEPEFMEYYRDTVFYCDKSGNFYKTNIMV